jgi:hypothetical protein
MSKRQTGRIAKTLPLLLLILAGCSNISGQDATRSPYYLGRSTAQAEQPQRATLNPVQRSTPATPTISQGAGKYKFIFGSGTYSGTATSKVSIQIAPDGTETVTFLEIDATQPIFIGGVIPTDPTDPTTPTDPVPPDDPKLAALQSAVTAIPLTASQTERAVMAKLYRDIAPLPVTTASQLKTLTDGMFAAVVSSTADAGVWNAWKSKVDSAVTSSGLTTLAEHVAAWRIIAEVLE